MYLIPTRITQIDSKKRQISKIDRYWLHLFENFYWASGGLTL